MAGKYKLENKNSKLKTVKLHTFAPYALIFALFVCTLLLTACTETTESGKIKTSQDTRIIQASGQEKKLKLLRAIERRFENPDAHFELAQLYQAEGSLVAAEYHYNTALRFDPVHRDAQAAMVMMLNNSGDTTKAKLLADTYMKEVANSAAGSRRLAVAFHKQGLDEYVLPCFQQSLRLEPNSSETYKQIGSYYLSKNDNVRARDFLSRSFELNPTQADVALKLGQLGVEIKIPQKIETNLEIPEKSVE
ncbi:MAG: tetratricopeptide repeat protein [Planctomycetota bacterium]